MKGMSWSFSTVNDLPTKFDEPFILSAAHVDPPATDMRRLAVMTAEDVLTVGVLRRRSKCSPSVREWSDALLNG